MSLLRTFRNSGNEFYEYRAPAFLLARYRHYHPGPRSIRYRRSRPAQRRSRAQRHGLVEGVQNALIYAGPISPTDSGGIHTLTPVFAGQSVTGATFYGPDTFAFNPSLGAGNIRAVGSYTYADSGGRNHGMLYQGPPSGGGTWTQIDVPSSVVGGKVVENTLAHSTMGDLVVGNYDLKGVPASANAFVYNITKKSWTIFDFDGVAMLTTAYGIWQAKIGDSSYVIVGGARHGGGINKGYVVRYDSETGAFSHLKFYSAMNKPSLITHFEGITATEAGFHLAGQSAHAGMALLASISVKPDGSFSEASWIPFAFRAASSPPATPCMRTC